MAERLQVILEMVTAAYKREAREVSTATRRMGDDIERTGTKTSHTRSQMSGLAATARVAVAGVATAAVVSFARSSIQAASDLNESINAVKKTFGEAGDAVLALGEDSAHSFGMSQSAFNAFSVRFSAFAKKIAEQDGRKVIDVVEEMTTRVADFASVQNLSLEEAAAVAQSTLAGETESFRRFGGDVSAAAVKLKAVELGLTGVGDELSEQEKILVRYKLFMEQTAKTAGDFADTQNELANATRVANAELEDAKAQIGGTLTPILGDMASGVADILGLLNDISVTSPKTGKEVTALGAAARVSFGGIFSVVSLAQDAYDEWFGTTENVARASGSSAGEVEVLAGSIGASGDIAADATRDHAVLAGSIEAEAFASDSAARAQRNLINAYLEAANPIFAAQAALDRLRTAQANLVTVQENGESTARDVATSQLDVASAALEAEDALAALGGGDVQAGIHAVAAALEISDTAAQDLLETLGILDGTTTTHVVEVNFQSSGDRAIRRSIVENNSRVPNNIAFRQHGGPVSAGMPYIVGERGPEFVIPAQSGMVVSNQATERILAALSGAGSIDRSLNVTYVNPRLADDPVESIRNTFALDTLANI